MTDNYQVIADIELTNRELQALTLLYQPLFSYNALSLYLSLIYTNSYTDEKALIKLTNDNVEMLELKRQELEQFGLLNTYVDNDVYTLVLKKPLEPKEFLKHAIFGRLYAIVCGQDNHKRMTSQFINGFEAIEGKDISKRLDPNRLAAWNESYEEEFNKKDSFELPNTFDVKKYFETIPGLVYPYEYRTKHVRDVVGEVGSRYAVDYETMTSIIVKSTNFETGEFNTRKFIFEVESTLGKMKIDPQDPYNVDPVSFLRFKQGFEYVADSDRKLLKSLSTNFGFTYEVINFLIEYILETNENNLSRAYVDKVASTWKRNDIDSVEAARNHIITQDQPRSKAKVKRVSTMPEYDKDTSIDEDEEMIHEEILRMLQKGGS